MQESEVFHIYHHGEQRGPYSARQVNHQYRCGYIGDETLYWRDGMEQWQAVTEIVERRLRKRRFGRWGIWAGIVALLGLLGVLFGPATLDAWRELTSGEFTAQSAWWRARSVVRERLNDGETVTFDKFSTAQVALSGKDAAVVQLSGQILGGRGTGSHLAWTVRMHFDADRRAWNFVPDAPASGDPAAGAVAMVRPSGGGGGPPAGPTVGGGGERVRSVLPAPLENRESASANSAP